MCRSRLSQHPQIRIHFCCFQNQREIYRKEKKKHYFKYTLVTIIKAKIKDPIGNQNRKKYIDFREMLELFWLSCQAESYYPSGLLIICLLTCLAKHTTVGPHQAQKVPLVREVFLWFTYESIHPTPAQLATICQDAMKCWVLHDNLFFLYASRFRISEVSQKTIFN